MSACVIVFITRRRCSRACARADVEDLNDALASVRCSRSWRCEIALWSAPVVNRASGCPAGLRKRSHGGVRRSEGLFAVVISLSLGGHWYRASGRGRMRSASLCGQAERLGACCE